MSKCISVDRLVHRVMRLVVSIELLRKCDCPFEALLIGFGKNGGINVLPAGITFVIRLRPPSTVIRSTNPASCASSGLVSACRCNVAIAWSLLRDGQRKWHRAVCYVDAV